MGRFAGLWSCKAVTTPILLVISMRLVSFAAADSPFPVNCYTRVLGNVYNQHQGWLPCVGTNLTENGAVSCCMQGSECGPGGLCYSPPSVTNPPPNNNSWYVAGCTDGTYQDSVCRVDCTNYLETFIQYDSANSDWACCGGGCNGTVTNQTFKAIAPPSFQSSAGQPLSTGAMQSSITSSASTSTSTSSATPTSSGSTTSSPPQSSQTSTTSSGSSGLSSGAKAGVGVGVAIGVIAIIGAGLLIFLRRRRQSNNSDSQLQPPRYDEVNHNTMQEVGDAAPKAELQGERAVAHELPGHSSA